MGTKAKNEISDRAKARTQRMINYLEVFTFPDLWWQPYPVYHVSAKGNMFSLKGILNIQNGKSSKKYSRKNQLVKRSTQAKIFDALININYWQPLLVAREFPFLIQNHNRYPGMKGSWFQADYFFPTALGGKGLAVELDSEYHNETSDAIRDRYLKETYGIEIFRLKNFERESVQKGKFQELCALLRSEQASDQPRIFNFSQTIQNYINEKLGPIGGMKLEDLSHLLINDENLDDLEV